MHRWYVTGLLVGLLAGPVGAVEDTAAPEIIEQLTRLEEGLIRVGENIAQLRGENQEIREGMRQLRNDMQVQNQQLRTDMQVQNQQLREDMRQLRNDMQVQNQQLRTDMNVQFERQTQLFIGLIGAFVVLFGSLLGYDIWDRRARAAGVRRVEEKQAATTEEVGILRAALLTIGERDERVGAILRHLHLL